MAADSPRIPKSTLELEIDRLMKHLPQADPSLLGEPEPARPRRPLVTTPATPAAEASGDGPLSVWWRASLAGIVGAAVTQWPYANDCGWMLYLYMGVVGTVVAAGVWASLWAWRVRIGAGHLLALAVVLWGLVLAAERVLPRTGYAAERAAWSCRV